MFFLWKMLSYSPSQVMAPACYFWSKQVIMSYKYIWSAVLGLLWTSLSILPWLFLICLENKINMVNEITKQFKKAGVPFRVSSGSSVRNKYRLPFRWELGRHLQGQLHLIYKSMIKNKTKPKPLKPYPEKLWIRGMHGIYMGTVLSTGCLSFQVHFF